MVRYRVTCIVKHEKYERILSLGCYSPDNVFLSFKEDEVIDRIENRRDTFYVERPSGHVADLEVAERDGRKYVKTVADGERPDNLLSLPTCPSKQRSTMTSTMLATVCEAATHVQEVCSWLWRNLQSGWRRVPRRLQSQPIPSLEKLPSLRVARRSVPIEAIFVRFLTMKLLEES